MAEKIIAFILLVLIIRFLIKIIMIPFRFLAGLFSGSRGSGYGLSTYGSSGRRAGYSGSSGYRTGSSGITYSSYRKDPEEEYYADIYEVYNGRRPNRPLTEDEKIDLEILDEMDMEEDFEDGCW